MKPPALFLLATLLPLLFVGALLRAHPSSVRTFDQVDASLCYHDPYLQIRASRYGPAGDGVFALTLRYCPSQQAYFGQFSLQETGMPLVQGGCFYIQNDVTAQGGQSGFQLLCPQQINPGDLMTVPASDDGHPWQVCWIDASHPQRVCTSFFPFSQ